MGKTKTKKQTTERIQFSFSPSLVPVLGFFPPQFLKADPTPKARLLCDSSQRSGLIVGHAVFYSPLVFFPVSLRLLVFFLLLLILFDSVEPEGTTEKTNRTQSKGKAEREGGRGGCQLPTWQVHVATPREQEGETFSRLTGGPGGSG